MIRSEWSLEMHCHVGHGPLLSGIHFVVLFPFYDLGVALLIIHHVAILKFVNIDGGALPGIFQLIRGVIRIYAGERGVSCGHSFSRIFYVND